MRVIIIGANGFLGKHLSEKLASQKEISLTLFSRKISETLRKITNNNCQYIEGNYINLMELVPLLKEQDVVYHLVSSSFPANSWENPILDINENLIPTIKLLEACVKAGVKKVVFISSGGAVYGKQEHLLSEKDLLKPFSPYGIIKASIEYFLEYFRIKDGLNYDIYRVSNAYGPYLDKPGFGVINTWLRLVSMNKPVTIKGDGENYKDYIFVKDVTKILAFSTQNDTSQSEIYNVCSSISTSLNEIITLLGEVTGKDIKVSYSKSLKSDNKIVRLNNEKIKQQLQKEKLVTLRDGIAKTWNYYMKMTD